MATQKEIPLEALRGLAAIAVLFGHVTLGFFPQYMVRANLPTKFLISHQVYAALFNGSAAVVLFFVLSGYVLTRKLLLDGDSRDTLRAATKRIPRLAGPIFVTVMLSYIILKMGLYHFEEVGRLTQSEWLSKFGSGVAILPFEPSFIEALRQASYGALFKGITSLDSSLWTMRIELIGSFLVFGLALMTQLLNNGRAIFGLLAFVLAAVASRAYCPFFAGFFLAAILPVKPFRLPPLLRFAAAIFAIYLLGYTGRDVGAFAPLFYIFGAQSSLAYVLGAAILITLLVGGNRYLSGQVGKWLGKLSFPLYLIHLPVICSIGCSTYLAAPPAYAAAMAVAVSIIASFVCCLPIVFFNEWWVAAVNRSTGFVFERSAAQGHGAAIASEK